MGLLNEFRPLLRLEALRPGLGANGGDSLSHRRCHGPGSAGRSQFFPVAIPTVDFLHALEHLGEVLEALLGTRAHPDYVPRRRRGKRRQLRIGVKALVLEHREEAAKLGRSQAALEDFCPTFCLTRPHVCFFEFSSHLLVHISVLAF